MKIKFPFFSRKLKAVCTTEQVIHQVDGQDKKLSEVLNSSGAHPLVTINGKDPLDYGEDSTLMLYLSKAVINMLDTIGISYLYFNSPVDLTFEMTSEYSADVRFITSAFRVATGVEVETVDEESHVVVGEVVKESRPSDDIRYNTDDMVSELCGALREMFEALYAKPTQDIFDYFNAQYSNN